MVFYKPRTYTATSRFTIGATTYQRGDTVPADEILGHAKRGMLLSKRYVMTDIDIGHGRVRPHKVKLQTPCWGPVRITNSPDTWTSAVDPVWPSATGGPVKSEPVKVEKPKPLVVPPAGPPLIGHEEPVKDSEPVVESEVDDDSDI